VRDVTPITGRYVWLWILGISIGFFEAAVVVYLRKLYYPAGFAFPIALASIDVALVEVSREVMSIVLLAAGARLAGRFFLERFAAFMVLFWIGQRGPSRGVVPRVL